jgi:hypothetical protein
VTTLWLKSGTVDEFTLALPGLTLVSGAPGSGKTRVLSLARASVPRRDVLFPRVRVVGHSPEWAGKHTHADWRALVVQGLGAEVAALAANLAGGPDGPRWGLAELGAALHGDEGRVARRAAEISVSLHRCAEGGLLVVDDILEALESTRTWRALVPARAALGTIVLCSDRDRTRCGPISPAQDLLRVAALAPGGPYRDVTVLRLESESDRGRLCDVKLIRVERPAGAGVRTTP